MIFFFFFFFDFSIEIQLDSFVVAVRQVDDIYRLLLRMDEGTKGESTRRNWGREGKENENGGIGEWEGERLKGGKKIKKRRGN